MDKDLHDFKLFMRQRSEASVAFVCGDIEPLDAISTHTSPATFFSPKGDCMEGAKKVNAANAAGANGFAPGSESHFEVLHIAADKDLAFWAGIQRAKVRMQGQPNAVQMDLRVTEVFRREDGAWKLVHRHADPLKEDPVDEKQGAAAKK